LTNIPPVKENNYENSIAEEKQSKRVLRMFPLSIKAYRIDSLDV
jgi:hypothetical protein